MLGQYLSVVCLDVVILLADMTLISHLQFLCFLLCSVAMERGGSEEREWFFMILPSSWKIWRFALQLSN